MASVQTAPNLPQGITQAAITETFSVRLPTFSLLNTFRDLALLHFGIFSF